MRRYTHRAAVSLVVLAALVPRATLAQTDSPAITARELQEHVRFLAADELQGRKAGTPGNERAAAYIAEQLRSYGLEPAGEKGTYYQSFEFVAAVKPGERNALSLKGTPFAGGALSTRVEADIRPLGLSENGTAEGTLVFAGYGVSAPDKMYDDYAGLDVKGKVVLVLRYGPDGDSPRSEFGRHTSLRTKARTAREKGAAGMIVITGPRDDDADEPMKLTYDRVPGSSGIAAISARRALFEPAFRAAGKDLKAIQDSIAASKTPGSFEFTGVSALMTADVVKVMDTTANVIARLKGSGASADEVVVLGAHFDHLGEGGPGSGSTRPDSIAVHNGADDNASGTAGLLELAQQFAASPPNRTLMFAFFSGEELGTLGSLHYIDNPPAPLKQTACMLNMDMIGRLKDSALTVGGSGTATEWNTLLRRHNADSSLKLQLTPDGFGPSDHAAFYGKDIPVLFFFTGIHDDYHTPADDWQLLNYPGHEKVVQYVYAIANDVANAPARPGYLKVASSQSSMGGDARGFAVTLGIVPDYTEGSAGMKISGVRANGPAEKAGLKTGDIIVKLGGKSILNIYDYMAILGELKAGQVVEVEVVREGKPMTFTATMDKRR